MSVVIKSNEFYYKDPTTGRYTGLNAIAEKSAERTIADIRTEGEKCLSAIEIKETEIISNVQSSLEALSSDIQARLDTKQDLLVFDSSPTAGSSNPVTSSGIATALSGLDNEWRSISSTLPYVFNAPAKAPEAYDANAAGRPVFWMVPNPGLFQHPALYPLVGTSSTNVFGRRSYRLVFALPVLERGVQKIEYRQVFCTVENGEVTTQGETAETITLQEKLTFDSAPADGSENPVTSGGVYSALAALEARVEALEQGGGVFGTATFGTGKFS